MQNINNRPNWGGGWYMGTLYYLPNFSVNLKQLKKHSQFVKKKIECIFLREAIFILEDKSWNKATVVYIND